MIANLSEVIAYWCATVDELTARIPELNDTDLVMLNDCAKKLEALSENAHRELVSRCQKCAAATNAPQMNNVGGMTMKTIRGSRYIDDLRAAYVAMRNDMSKDMFLQACSVSVPKLEKLYVSARLAAVPHSSEDEKIVLNEFNQKMDGVIKHRPDRQVLTRTAGSPKTNLASPPPEEPLQ